MTQSGLMRLILSVFLLAALSRIVPPTMANSEPVCVLPNDIADMLDTMLYWQSRGKHWHPESYDAVLRFYVAGDTTHAGPFIGGALSASDRLTSNISQEDWAACGLEVDCPSGFNEGYCDD